MVKGEKIHWTSPYSKLPLVQCCLSRFATHFELPRRCRSQVYGAERNLGLLGEVSRWTAAEWFQRRRGIYLVSWQVEVGNQHFCTFSGCGGKDIRTNVSASKSYTCLPCIEWLDWFGSWFQYVTERTQEWNLFLLYPLSLHSVPMPQFEEDEISNLGVFFSSLFLFPNYHRPSNKLNPLVLPNILMWGPRKNNYAKAIKIIS